MNQTIPYSFNKMAVYKQPSIPEPIIALDTIPAISWDFENASTSAVNFSNYVTYDGSSTLNYSITETLPIGVSLNNSTLSADKSLMTGDVDTTLTLNVSASDVLSTATEQFDLEIVNVIEPVPPQPEPSAVPLTFENYGQNGTFKAACKHSAYYMLNDSGEWTTTAPSIGPGDKVAISSNYWVDNQGWRAGTNAVFTFSKDGDPYIKAYGNIMSLYDWRDTPPQYGFRYAFYQNFGIRDVSELILPPNVSNGCYVCMFEANRSLTATPSVFPATTVVGSSNGCYQAMFKGCSNLLIGPTVISAITVSGTNTVAFNQMFVNCSKLSTGVQLFITDIVGKKCFTDMFVNCNYLPWVKVHFTTWDTNSTYNTEWRGWLNNAGNLASNPTFYKPTSLTVPSRDGAGVPSNWTIVDF